MISEFFGENANVQTAFFAEVKMWGYFFCGIHIKMPRDTARYGYGEIYTDILRYAERPRTPGV